MEPILAECQRTWEVDGDWQVREATVNTAPRISLSDILRDADSSLGTFEYPLGATTNGRAATLSAEVEWRAAIAALGHLLRSLPRLTALESSSNDDVMGIGLSGPLPVLNDADLGLRLDTWVVTPQPLADALNGQRLLLPSSGEAHHPLESQALQVIPLTSSNPLLTERFCLVVTDIFSVGLVLGQPIGEAVCFQYSFEPSVLLQFWQHVQLHLADSVADRLQVLDEQISRFIAAPDYRLVTRFARGMLAHLPHRQLGTALTLEEHGHVRWASWSSAAPRRPATNDDRPSSSLIRPAMALGGDPTQNPASPESRTNSPQEADTELLRAMAHEIRTPLTTIRTLTRSLMRRQELTPEVQKRLARIDQECTQQIDRFNLIFRAVELETTDRDRTQSCLTPIALTHIFQDAIPRWQQQAHRRNLSLDVTLPHNLPRVTSDPTLLDQVLTGVVEWFTQCLPAQSHIQMRVTLAGHQLKLQFEAKPTATAYQARGHSAPERQPLKSLGQLLTIAPDTGGLSLNLDVTKNLFQFLGGKLIVRQRPQQGDVLTVFLPLDTREV